MATTIPTGLRYSPPASSFEDKPNQFPSTRDHLYNLTQTPTFIRNKQAQDLAEAKIDTKLYQLPCKDIVTSLLFMRRFIAREKTKQFEFDTTSRLYWGTITKKHLEESNEYIETISNAVNLEDTNACIAIKKYMTSNRIILPKDQVQ